MSLGISPRRPRGATCPLRRQPKWIAGPSQPAQSGRRSEDQGRQRRLMRSACYTKCSAVCRAAAQKKAS